MAQGGAAAVGSDEPVIGNSEVRRLEESIHQLERLLGRKTLEVEILRTNLNRYESHGIWLKLTETRAG
jgi:transposase